jgi:nicotinamidase-related amidase
MNKALIIVDMWDNHWDLNTKNALSGLSNDINEFADVFRSNNDLVIHAPSKVTRQYRKRNLNIDYTYKLLEKDVLVDRLKKLKFPLILDGNGRPNWKKQHPNIEIKDVDYVTTNGSEIYNLLKQNKIEKLYYCGAHANICILWTRQFSILQMQYNGIDTALIKDLSLSLPTNQYDELISFYDQYICETTFKKEIYA